MTPAARGGDFHGSFRAAADAPQPAFFGASNSGEGFVSYFDGIFRERCDRRLILKGGPGTGKSRTLYDIARRASDAGARIEYYFCSSDPDSLDGITAIFPDGRTFGAQDATAPHAEEASLPGARDEIFDLGAFWNSERLSAERDEIERLNLEKSRAWSRAFGCLAAAQRLRLTALGMARTVIDGERFEKVAARAAGDARRSAAATEVMSELPPLPPRRGGAVLRSPHRSLGMKGAVSLDGIYCGAREIYVISDGILPGIGELFLTSVADAAVKSGMRCRISPDPLCPGLCAAFVTGGVVYTADRADGLPVTGAAVHRVGIRRFIDSSGLRSISGEYARISALSDSAVSAALSAMSDAARAHFALEEIYSAAMDFDAKEAASLAAAEEFSAHYL